LAAGAAQFKVTTEPFSAPDPPGTLTTSQQNNIQALFDMSYESVDLTNAAQVGGFQTALWEVIYDDDLNLGTGAFQSVRRHVRWRNERGSLGVHLSCEYC
jgi:hypothetical protein